MRHDAPVSFDGMDHRTAWRRGLPSLIAVSSIVLAAVPACAQNPPIVVNPNRPTFATPAQTTQVGVAELEIGVQRTTARDGGVALSSPFLLKLGLWPRLELRLGGNGVLRQTDEAATTATGLGDLTVGAQCRYLHGPFGIDQSVQLTWKAPTASATKGLGSGEPDGTLMLILSRDVGRFHGDVNVLETWIGRSRAEGGGVEHQPAATVSLSRTLGARWSLTGEVYSLGATSRSLAIVSNLWALAYKVSPRLVLDAGADAGLSHGAPRLSLFSGLTVGLARLWPRAPSLHRNSSTYHAAGWRAEDNAILTFGRRAAANDRPE